MDMAGMNHTRGMAVPPSIAAANGTARHRHMMMHMTFFWGKNTEVLFSGWPGFDNVGMYVLSMVVVFGLAVLVEWISNCNYIKESANRVTAGVIQTAMYGVRIGLAYLLMLAVMSLNGGIFLVAVSGHVAGFFFFGSRAFNPPPPPTTAYEKTTDLPPLSCNC